MSLGTNIKKRRFELGMSQQELADALGYKTRSTIAKIESGENDITQKKLIRFAQALDTTPEALMSGSGASQAHRAAKQGGPDESAAAVRKDKNVALILAGGKSSRNQQNIPNQFINVLGKPVIVYCLEAYQTHPAIDDIYIICLKGWEKIVSAYAEQYHITKLRGLIPAGSSGILSVKNGLDYIADRYAPSDIVIFQESTRPLVSEDMISKLLQSCYENDSAIICQVAKDVVQFSYEQVKARYIDRNSIVVSQSPEAYRISVISEVFEKAKKQQHSFSESCCSLLLYNLGYDINFIEGSIYNNKIVRQEDIAILTALIKLRQNY